MFHLHLYTGDTAAQSQYWGTSGDTHDLYAEPWVSFTDDIDERVRYNRTTPLTFQFTTSGSVKWTKNGTVGAKPIMYRKNNENTWTTLAGTSNASFNVAAGDIIQFRGNNDQYATSITGQSIPTGFSFCGTTGTFSVYGNIMSIVNSEDYPDMVTLPSAFTFTGLFWGCSGLTSASNLVLPAKILTDSCYAQLFHNCGSLTTGPALPATMLTPGCYQELFAFCTSLTTAPELPARSVKNQSYWAMFALCTSLTTAPELPATEVGCMGYNSMFIGCSSLTTPPPSLPAMYPEDECYTNMFSGCTSLTGTPIFNTVEWIHVDSPSFQTAGYAHCNMMFAGCTSLTVAPELPAKNAPDLVYGSMFVNCTALTQAPSILPAMELMPAVTTQRGCYSTMFSGCTSLTTSPILPAETLVYLCYNCMFEGCSSLNTVTCLAKNPTSATSPTPDWLLNVSSSGTFYRAPGVSWGASGSSGIPSGWTIVDYTG